MKMKSRKLYSVAIATTFVLAACAAAGSAPARQAAPSPDGAGEYVYVPNQDDATVSLIDRESLREADRIELTTLGFGPNAKPHHVVVEPDGSHWYLSLIGENHVLKFDRENRVVGRVEMEVPGLLALHPSEDRLYVGRSMSAVNPPRSVAVIRRSSMELLDEIEVLYPRPHALAVRPQGDVLYSASLAENRLAAIDLATDEVEISTLDGPTHTLVQFAVSPDGRWMVATGQLTARMLVFDLADPMRPRPVRSVEVGAEPWHPVFSPDGGTVWFANKGANTVTAVDAESWTVAGVVRGDALAQPHGAAVSPDGRRVYISSNDLDDAYGEDGAGTFVVIDAERREIVEVVEVGLNAAGIGTPGGDDRAASTGG
ncbi:MAG: YncE family protein [Gemmatimonadota bacterium]